MWVLSSSSSSSIDLLRQVVSFQENYGKNDKESSSKVKQLYNELSMDKVFKDYEQVSYNRMLHLMEEKAAGLPRGIFEDFIAKIYKRKK